MDGVFIFESADYHAFMANVEKFIFSPFQENTYLVYEDGEVVIIDPGCFDADEKQLLSDFIKEHNLKPVRFINTHCHLDHIFGNRYVAETYQLPLEIHEKEVPILEAADSFASAFGVPAPDSPDAGKFLEEGDEVKVGQTNLKVIFTPGHSPGHIALYSENDRFVVSADVLFQGGIGRTDLPGGDFDTLINTIKEKLYPLGDDVTVYPGHGPETTIGQEKAANPFLQD